MGNKAIFGFLKSHMDAHTMGVNAAANLLKACGYVVVIASEKIECAIDKIESESSQKLILEWIRENKISNLGVSYRLDPQDAINIVGKLVYMLKRNAFYECENAIIKHIHFAGLKDACDYINQEYDGRICTFQGGESDEESLLTMGVLPEEIPITITEGCKYDKELLKFGRNLINSGGYVNCKPLIRNHYADFGTTDDGVLKRLQSNFADGFQPLIRAHSGPYSPEMSREQCLQKYNEWCKELAESGFLDILSIGSSQLSQSNFGEKWGDRPNGGGVPVNSESEYSDIWKAARPMLVRTYSGTKNIVRLAEMYERKINIVWHALSLWWFDELDGRGPNTLYDNLCEHIDTIKYIASMNKPLETNISHHFAFRGCDDVTYIVSAYLGARIAKKYGIKVFILQNMLNTPRSTWGIQDLAKSRVMIKLVKELEDEQFRVILQTRAGLNYFKPNIDEAKVQLSAVTALMDDIDPQNEYSPEIIHVVSYSEALFLATPEIINDSIKITRTSLAEYRKLRKQGLTPDVWTSDIISRMANLEQDARRIISSMEKEIPDLYSSSGLYLAFVAGWLPVPDLWNNSDEFLLAKKWQTKSVNGGISIVNNEMVMSIEKRIDKCIANMDEARYMLKENFKKSVIIQ